MIFFQTKMLFKEFLIWAFWGQTVGLVWVKNCKKDYFHIPAMLLLQPSFFSLKTKFLTAIVS